MADIGEAGADSSGQINLGFEQSDDILHTPSQGVLLKILTWIEGYFWIAGVGWMIFFGLGNF